MNIQSSPRWPLSFIITVMKPFFPAHWRHDDKVYEISHFLIDRIYAGEIRMLTTPQSSSIESEWKHWMSNRIRVPERLSYSDFPQTKQNTERV